MQLRTSSPAGAVQVTPVQLSGALQKTWTLELKDVNYYGSFQRWATEAGYQVRWDAEKHFLVEAVDTFSGSFEDAVDRVLKTSRRLLKYPLSLFLSQHPPLARSHAKASKRGMPVNDKK
jgi:hypothetical protein